MKEDNYGAFVSEEGEPRVTRSSLQQGQVWDHVPVELLQ